jgi:glycosyltransferase involved in cell wall biosynthesis
MTDCIAFDITRLFVGPIVATPRGIDRVDLAYARHFFEQWAGDSVGVLPTPWGIRWFDRYRSLCVINFIEDFWNEAKEPDDDPAYHWVKSRIKGERPTVLPANNNSAAARLAYGFVSFYKRYGLALGRPIRSVPEGATYLNTGQITLAVPQFLNWLGGRSDVKPIFMLHDVIPIEHPEFCSPRSTRLHAHMIANTAHYASGLIVTTQAAGVSIRHALTRLNRFDLATIAATLAVPSPFLKPTAPDPDLDGTVYFVVTGAIEPRKNHLLLLNVWQRLVEEMGPSTPKLVLVGSRWRASGAVVELLDRCQAIKDHVIEVGQLSTPALRQLLAGARALLMPSLAEGFGLPIIEALALGTPVIASDLPSHREAAGGYARHIAASDELGWLGTIRTYASAAEATTDARSLARLYRAPTWADYFQRIEPFVRSAERRPRTSRGMVRRGGYPT